MSGEHKEESKEDSSPHRDDIGSTLSSTHRSGAHPTTSYRVKLPTGIDLPDLLKAAYLGDSGWASEVLKKGDDTLLLQTDHVGKNVLHIAAQKNDLKMLETVMNHGIRSEMKEHDRRIKALYRKAKDHARVSTEKDAQIFEEWVNEEEARMERVHLMTLERHRNKIASSKDNSGNTPLHYAAAMHGQLVEFILKKSGVNFQQSSVGHTKVMQAKKHYDKENGKEVSVEISDPSKTTNLRQLKLERRDMVNTGNHQGYTPLMFAALSGNVSSIKVLLDYGASKEIKNLDGETALDMASNNVARRTIMMLTEAVELACVPTHHQKGGTSGGIERGSEVDKDAAMHYLIDCGSDVNMRTGFLLQAPLHKAAQVGDVKTAQYLVSVGAKVDIPDSNGWTPLHFCSSLGSIKHRDTAEYLLSAGANPRSISNSFHTPLHLNAMQNWVVKSSNPATRVGENSSIMQLLESRGADLNARDDEGHVPLHYACRRGRAEAAHCLLSLGCDPYAVNIRGWNALHFACYEGHGTVVRLLARYDCESKKLKNMRSSSGKLPFDICKDQKTRLELENLFEAAESGQQDQIRLMLQHSHQLTERKPWLHAKITCTTQKNHRTALHMCVMGAVRALETARTTLRESKETMKNNGRTASTLGAVTKAQEAIGQTEKKFALATQFLLQMGAPIDAKDVSGLTAIMFAAKGGVLQVLEVLFRNGASVHQTDSNGNTALHFAYAYTNTEVANALESMGSDLGACNANGKTPVGVIGLKKKIMTHKKLKSPKYRGSRAPSPVVKLKSSTLSTDEDFETTLSRGDDSDEKAKVNAKSESDREDKLTPRGDGVER